MTNRLTTSDFVPAFRSHKLSLFRASGRTCKRRSLDALGGTSEACFYTKMYIGRQSCKTSPCQPAECPDETKPLYVRVSNSTSYVRLFWVELLGRHSSCIPSMPLIRTKDCSSMGKQFCLQPTLPHPARRPGRPPRPNEPVYVSVWTRWVEK